MVVAPEERTRSTPPSTIERLATPIRFRGDVEGLRAVAVVLVLLDHAGLPVTGGFVGVDVFFVISGFLITSLLLSELVTTRRISLRGFYARRARRLLPGAAAVLVVTGVLTMIFIPRTRWIDVGYDILASTFYVQNWRLAALAVDYQAQDGIASPLQHFWSLAVEEQFYIVWPLLLLGVAYLIRSRRLGHRRSSGSLVGSDPRTQRRTVVALAVGLSLVGVPSFVWSVLYTAANPAGAYFVTTTRLWELAVGGGVALAVGVFATLSPRTAAVLGWAGLAAIAVSAALYTASTQFPGVAALLPVLGAAAVLGAGQAGSAGPAAVLDTRPMRWVGKLSYSLYLWHWPLLMIAATVAGERSMVLGTVVVALSVVPAYLCFRYVEDPIRKAVRLRKTPSRSLAVGGVCSGVAMTAAFVVLFSVWPPPSPMNSQPVTLDLSSGSASSSAVKRGAMVLADNPRDDPAGAPVDSVPSISPDPQAAKGDVGGNCNTALTDVEIRSCTGGDSSSPIQVALLGDSHAEQWNSALRIVAKDRKWNLTTYTKAGCPFLMQDVAISLDENQQLTATRPYSECAQWRDKVLDKLTTGPKAPDMIIVSSGEHLAMQGSRVFIGPPSEALITQGYKDAWARFTDKGSKLVVLADTPTPKINMADCVSDHRDSLTKCTLPRTDANSADGSSLVAAAKSTPGAQLIDLSDAICPTEQCAAVIGGVLVWRDSNHVSSTYMSTLAPRLDKLLPQLP